MRRAIRLIAPARWLSSVALVGVTALAAATSPSTPRALALAAALTLATGAALAEARGAADERLAASRNLLAMAGLLLLATASTGGVASPLAAGIPLVTGVVFLVAPRRAAWATLAIEAAALWALAWLDPTPEAARRAIALPGWLGPALAPAVLTVIMLGAARVGVVIDRVVDGLLLDVDRSHDEAIAAHREQLHELTALSGEIAHELKNPLASVKGLAALLSRDAQGKAAERIEVLRREVDRVLATLEELLSLSRPLSPLATAEVDLRALCDDVARLHEGVAAERGIALACDGDDRARCVCDRRKVKQILTNLLQNALDAAPRGSAIHLRARASEGGARVEIEDRGAGLPDEVRRRLFQRGVTSKRGGSGIGLPISRALARQHGGDLAIGDRAGGGAIATLVLPARAAEEGA